jgi:hypothetical protein
MRARHVNGSAVCSNGTEPVADRELATGSKELATQIAERFAIWVDDLRSTEGADLATTASEAIRSLADIREDLVTVVHLCNIESNGLKAKVAEVQRRVASEGIPGRPVTELVEELRKAAKKRSLGDT